MPIFALFANWFQRTPLPGRPAGTSITRLTLALLAVMVAHVIAISWLEDLTPWQAIWLSLVTVSTVGYGDVSAKTTLGQIATVSLLIIPGIMLFSKLLSQIVDDRAMRRSRQLTGAWKWPMKNHILVFNAPQNVENYMSIVVQEFNKYPDYQHAPVQVVSTRFPHGLPTKLQDMNVLLYTGSGNSQDTLEAVSANLAKVILVLAPDPEDNNSDAATFDLIHRLRDMGSTAYIVAESIMDSNRARLRRAGANATMRPIRAYPEIAVRSVLAPGSELVIEELFDSAGSEYRRVNTPATTMQWSEVVARCVGNDLGTPLAYVMADERIVINAVGSQQAEFTGLILAVLDTANWVDDDLVAALSKA